MKISLRSAVLALCAVPVIACQPAGPTFTAKDEADVKAIFDSTVSYVRAGKFDAWSMLFAPDAKFHIANMPIVSGRPAILAWGKSLPPMNTFTFTDLAISGDGNIAYGSSRVFLQMKDLPADTTKQLVVLKRDATGKWFTQVASISSDLPLPMAAPAPKKK